VREVANEAHESKTTERGGGGGKGYAQVQTGNILIGDDNPGIRRLTFNKAVISKVI